MEKSNPEHRKLLSASARFSIYEKLIHNYTKMLSAKSEKVFPTRTLHCETPGND
jgi:hypothetical protein